MGNPGAPYGGTPTFYGPPGGTQGGYQGGNGSSQGSYVPSQLPDRGLYFSSPAASATGYQGTTSLGAPQPAGNYGGKNQPSYPQNLNVIPGGMQGPHQSVYNPNFRVDQVTTPNNNWAGSYLTQGPDIPVPGMQQTVGGSPFSGFSFLNPYLLGPFQNSLGGAASPYGVSPSWSSGGKGW